MAATEQLHRLTDDFATTRLAPTEERVIYVCPGCKCKGWGPGQCGCAKSRGRPMRRADKSDLLDPTVSGRRP